ncbi:MAG: N-acetylmuramoyl-L-alanine amidase [Bacteroidaceae bacterium]|nr:N-acetylmuramoyl-L-alanine amidase [Bacteroidaceae bacterium]
MKYINYILVLLLLLMPASVTVFAGPARDGKSAFTLVIDAGHGGNDPGAVGRKAKEKTINLNVALALGKMINNAFPEVNVIYTRKTDKRVSLMDRAAIANRAKADLFISIHTNASKSRKARGCETFTLGSGSSAEAKKAAMYENEAILLEDNFQETYKGFDPRSTESYIIFELIRSHDMEKSIHCAEAIQKKMVGRSKLPNRGVSNAGFLVLHQTAMPSILVELGFITNSTEEAFLSSSSGQQALTKGIFEGFSAYYKQYGAVKTSSAKPQKPATTATATAKPKQTATTAAKPKQTTAPAAKAAQNTAGTSAPVFKIQILTSDKQLAAKDKRLKGLKAEYYKEKGLYKYTHGSSENYNEILALRKKIAPQFKEAFIIAFRDGVKIDTQEAIKEFKQKK